MTAKSNNDCASSGLADETAANPGRCPGLEDGCPFGAKATTTAIAVRSLFLGGGLPFGVVRTRPGPGLEGCRSFGAKDTRAKLAVCLRILWVLWGGLLLCGCKETPPGGADVLYVIGRTGAGDGEFTYPRGLDLAADGTLWVVDKTGRVQHLGAKGKPLGAFHMPETEAGKPVGLTVGPDGNLYVPDTHYHRVLVMSPEGKVLRRIGSLGQGDGQFIYPTDVAFAPLGGPMRMLVSEYGGNDRISVFDLEGKFLRSVGSSGSEVGQFSRPAAMAVDLARKRLYVADACNHRVAVYDFGLNLVGAFGAPGTEPGRMRYPYGLAVMPDGSVAVSEFGNNRLQIFSPGAKSVAIRGVPGREPGQLVYPWGIAVDARKRAFIADGGNNRIQVWQL